MSSLLRNISERFTPTQSSTDLSAFQKAKKETDLFPSTTPDVDGEECLHDCESCTIHLPKKFSIDEDDKLYGFVKGWSTHLIVGTGKTDWVRDVEDEKGSVMEAVGKHHGEVKNGRLMLSASNMPVPHDDHSDGPYGKDRPTTVLLLPAFTFVDNVTPNTVPDLIDGCINKAPVNNSRLTSSSSANASNGTPDDSLKISIPTSLPAGLSLRPCGHKALILLCSQATRDARCGQSAPLIRRELERHLRPLGLYRDLEDSRPGGVGIYFISHVGGHKYSANMMIYRQAEPARTVEQQMANGNGVAHGEAAQCIWLARVRPEDCENIVRFTVLQGKVVKPERQLRGGFDREKGLVSW